MRKHKKTTKPEWLGRKTHKKGLILLIFLETEMLHIDGLLLCETLQD